MKAERDVDAFYSALYMQDKIGEKFKAVISAWRSSASLRAGGVFVEPHPGGVAG